MQRRCSVLHLGLVEYGEALALQEGLVRQRQAGEIEDALVLLQHFPVITLGRRANSDNILATREALDREGIALYQASRGGDVTYHGPGQLVGYPILRLEDHGDDVWRYLRSLEEALILLLRGYGIKAEQVPGYTGVWVGRAKMAAIGVAVKGGVTMHGFALNVDPNLAHFRLINPCGYTDRGVTSMSACLNRPVDFGQVQLAFPAHFGQVFGAEIAQASERGCSLLTPAADGLRDAPTHSKV